jgi:hypothetical protein
MEAAVARAAGDDVDELVRAVTTAVVDGRPDDVRSRKALRSRSWHSPIASASGRAYR